MKIRLTVLSLICGGCLFLKIVQFAQSMRLVPGFGGEYLLIPLIVLIWYFQRDVRRTLKEIKENCAKDIVSEKECKPDNPERDRAA